MRNDALLVRVTAAPAEGAANDAVLDLLSRTFDLPRRQFTIASGHHARDKRIEVHGLEQAEITGRVSAILRRTR